MPSETSATPHARSTASKSKAILQSRPCSAASPAIASSGRCQGEGRGSESRRPLQDEASASLSHPSGIVAGMEASGSVRYRRAIMRVVTPTSIAGQLNEVRQAAAAFGVDAVVDALERTAQEALAVARTEE